MEREDLLTAIAAIARDYRNTDGIHIDGNHVENWIDQFEAQHQIPILREIAHVLNKTYIPRSVVENFLEGLFLNEELAGKSPENFWPNVEILNIQQAGASQRHLGAIFKSIIERYCGIGSADALAGANGTFVYIDDGIFTGNRVKRDLEDWISHDAPANATIHIVVMALHLGGQYYAHQRIEAAANSAGKALDIHWWRIVELEDRKAFTDTSDVLRPVVIPQVPSVLAHVNAMSRPPRLRVAGSTGKNSLYSSDEARQLLENEFLKAGVHIREMCPALGSSQRPLGHMTLETLGFGSLIVTFRNCPNNAPLAFWAGAPWYPLFPRSTNSETSLQNFLQDLEIG